MWNLLRETNLSLNNIVYFNIQERQYEKHFGNICLMCKPLYIDKYTEYSETSIHRFRQGSEKETMDPGKQ
jgi:hypothetical protein